VCILVVAFDVDEDLFNHRAKKLFAITVSGRRCRPRTFNIFAKGKNLSALLGAQDTRLFGLASRQIHLGGMEFMQALCPVCLKAAGHQAVVWIDGAIAPLCSLGFVAGAFDLEFDLRDDSVLVGIDLLGRQERSFKPSGSQGGDEGACDGGVDLATANPHAVFTTAVGDIVAGALVRGSGEFARIGNEQLATPTPTPGQSLEQRCAFSHGTTWLMGPWTCVAFDPGLIGLESCPIDEAGVVIANENGPLGLRPLAYAFSYIPVFIDKALKARFAIDIGASIHRVGQDLVNFRVGRGHPADICAGILPRGKQQALGAEMQPHTPGRVHFGEAIEDGLNCASNGLVGIEKDLAVGFTENQANGQTTAQLPTLGFVANAAVETGTKHM
jgi:hypothetical protein